MKRQRRRTVRALSKRFSDALGAANVGALTAAGMTAPLEGLAPFPSFLVEWWAWMEKQPAMPTMIAHMSMKPITVAVWYASPCSPWKPLDACMRSVTCASSCQ